MFKKVALLAVMICAISSLCYAGLILDLRTTDSTIIDHVGQTVNFSVYGVLPSGSATTTITGVAMNFQSVEDASGGLQGNISNVLRNVAFSAVGSNGTERQYDPNPDMEWGGPVPATSVTGSFYPASISAVKVNADGSLLLGSFTWTATQIGPGTSAISAFPYMNATTQNGIFKYAVDGVTLSNAAANNITSGGPVPLVGVPEPSTIILLGMGALALVFIRRRK